MQADTRRVWYRRAFLALAALYVPRFATAQQYGQWSWDGATAGTVRSHRNVLDGFPTASDDERSADLSLGLNGFLGHPALGRFTLAGTVGLVNYRGSRVFETRRWGFNGSLSALPQGRFPLTLYANRQAYSYSRLTLDDPLALVGIPDTSTSYGGRLRLRSGPLRGTLFGYDHWRTSYRGADRASAFEQEAFADWGRGGRRFSQHVRLEQRHQRFGLVDYGIGDLTGTFDQTGRLSEAWRWQMSAYAFRRRVDYSGGVSRFDNARTSQHLNDVIGPRATVDIGYDGGLSRGGGADFQSHTALVRLQLRPNRSWSLTPYAGYGVQERTGAQARIPQAGVSASWVRSAGAVDLVVSEGVGVAWFQRQAGPSDASLSLSMGLTAGMGDELGLRREVEASFARNSLRRAGETIEGLADAGVGLTGLGTEDVARGRLTLRRRLGSSLSLFGYGEASHRTFTDPTLSAGVPRSGADALTGTLQAGGRRGTLAGNVGSVRAEAGTVQSIRYWAATLTLRPAQRLSVHASFRGDRREVKLAPDLETDRWEAAADLALGAFVLKGQGFQTTEHPRTAPERRNRGFTLSLSRHFSGWLPIVTGLPNGGVIQ